MSKQLIEQLKSLKDYNGRLKPDHVWVDNTRNRLLRQITNNVTESKRSVPAKELVSWFIPESIAHAARPAMAMIMISIMTVGGWIVGVNASYDSLPGEVLYGVKIATEKTQVALATVSRDKVVETKLHLEFASRRSEETKKIVENNEGEDKAERAQKTVVKLKKSIESAKESAKEVNNTSLSEAVSVAKDLTKATQEIKKELIEVTKEIEGGNDETDTGSLVKEVAEATSLVKAAELDVIEKVVKQLDEDVEKEDSESSNEDVAELVAETIAELSVSVQEVKDTIKDEIKPDAEAVEKTTSESEINEEVLEDLKETLLASSTMATDSEKDQVKEAENLEDIKDKIVEVVDKVDETVERAGEIIQQAQELVENNNLLDAIHKAQEAQEVNTETAQAVVEVKDAIKKTKEINNELEEVVDPVQAPVESENNESDIE